MLEEELARTERQIYELEEEYLQETVKDGNILRGWDGYLGVQVCRRSSPLAQRASCHRRRRIHYPRGRLR